MVHKVQFEANVPPIVDLISSIIIRGDDAKIILDNGSIIEVKSHQRIILLNNDYLEIFEDNNGDKLILGRIKLTKIIGAISWILLNLMMSILWWVKRKITGDPVGEFRVIRYDTGYYALQKKIIGLSDSSDLDWETIVIAPQLDTPLDNEYDWKFSQGNLTMNMLLQHLDNSSKLHNNELMELHLNLNTNL